LSCVKRPGSFTDLSGSAKSKGFSGLDMKASGPGCPVSMDYMLTESAMLNVYVDTAGTTYLAGDKVKVDVDVDPFVYVVGLGYTF
jgi:outer membrane protein